MDIRFNKLFQQEGFDLIYNFDSKGNCLNEYDA
jgi:hypothetical protein